ncbi:5'-3' exonuclease [Kribbella sp. CA-293567]|uniref:5'-3' exonuclease n=1 Tax=Kribbella sp. CA-293567 TaxID=3002436 RepID=UPI0022DD94FB|nr:5'-3' exonuclease H3TH domain-containing protein [Kribbella sp. CA-293567]WBQ08646.1 flap endonuclease [Kribbella sp. CA-293567]
MLLDTASLYFRAFFGVPDTMKAADGTPTNAIRGLLDFIARLVDNHQPTHLVACWDDNWRPSWRVALIPSYKAQRVEFVATGGEQVEDVPDRLELQVPYIRACLEALGIPIVGAPDHEADDVIGTLSHQAKMPVDVVTGDRDLFQLIDDSRGIRIIYTAAKGVGRADVYDEKALLAKYEIPASRYADYATLRGDASDGLPGVKGVGEKTAMSLITAYGDLAAIRAAAADPGTPMSPSVKRKILDSSDYLDVAPKVVAVAKDAPVGSFDATLPAQVHDPEKWLDLVELLELGSSAQRVMAALKLGPKDSV